MVALLVKAVAASLKAFPDFNSSLDGDELVLKRYYNIGFAADTPERARRPGDQGRRPEGHARDRARADRAVGKARDGKLSRPTCRAGRSRSRASAASAAPRFTPIVNAPEVAILGVTRSAMKPVWDGREFGPRLMVPLSLSYDHRVIDGAAAARFFAHLAQVLGDLRRVLL